MLASSGALPEGSRWRYEPKLDGWRLIVEVNDDSVRAFTRNGVEMAASVPELAGLVEVVGRRRVVLDGELVADAGRASDFYPLLGRVSKRGSSRYRGDGGAVTFVAFDCLVFDGEPIVTARHDRRREALMSLRLSGPQWSTLPSFDTADGLLDACAELGIEGIVAKRVDTTYRAGERSRHWIKRKTPEWREKHAARRHIAP